MNELEHIPVRVATRQDFISNVKTATGDKERPAYKKDFFVMNAEGLLEYYRYGDHLAGMLRELLPEGRVYVIDVERVERQWMGKLKTKMKDS